MPIINNELVNPKPIEELKDPKQSVGDYLISNIKRNIESCGDKTWLVS